jgi:hypothetical protein
MMGVVKLYYLKLKKKNIMGTHTWFVKDGDVQLELRKQNSMFTDDTPDEVYDEWQQKYKDNRIDGDKYFNLFRIRGNENNWDTIDEIYLRSYEESLKFIEDSEYEIVVGDYPMDEGMKLLKEYWEEYPNGMIYFG